MVGATVTLQLLLRHWSWAGLLPACITEMLGRGASLSDCVQNSDNYVCLDFQDQV